MSTTQNSAYLAEGTLSYSVGWNTICATALTLVGRDGTADYATDDSEDARYCRVFLPEAVEAAAGYFDWTFLRKHKNLSYDTTVTTGPYSYAYLLPGDIARLTKVTTYNDLEFVIIGQTIWTDSETCSILYQQLPERPDTLPASFCAAIQHYLAYLLSKPLTGNESLAQYEMQMFQYWIEKACEADRAYLSDKGEKWWTELIDG